jgi:hypothetical protein
VAVPPPPPQELPTPVDAAVPFAVALVVATGAFAWRRLRGGKPLQRRSPQQPQYDAALEVRPPHPPACRPVPPHPAPPRIDP